MGQCHLTGRKDHRRTPLAEFGQQSGVAHPRLGFDSLHSRHSRELVDGFAYLPIGPLGSFRPGTFSRQAYGVTADDILTLVIRGSAFETCRPFRVLSYIQPSRPATIIVAIAASNRFSDQKDCVGARVEKNFFLDRAGSPALIRLSG